MNLLKDLTGNKNSLFFSEHLFCKPYAAPFAGNACSGLISWTLLNEIFNIGHKDCWLVQNGRLLPSPLNSGCLSLPIAQEYFSKGCTVLVRHAERAHPKLATLAKSFKDHFRTTVDMQLYCTPAGQEGFDWHYDVEDVFIVQSQGEKEFRLLANTVTPQPLPMMSSQNYFLNEKLKPEIRCLLRSGDWLYIPAGYWHKARALSDSFHLSVGVM